MGYGGFERHAGCLHHQSIRRGAAGAGVSPGWSDRDEPLLLGAFSQPAGLSCGNRGLRYPERNFLRNVVQLSEVYAPASRHVLRCAARYDRWGGRPAVHAFSQSACNGSFSR